MPADPVRSARPSAAGDRGRGAGARRLAERGSRRLARRYRDVSASIRPRTSVPSADGGAITTDDAELAERALALRFHGSRDMQDLRVRRLQLAPGRDPSRDPARAAAADRQVVRRPPRGRAALPRRRDRRASSSWASPPLGATPAWHLYVATHADADAKLKALNEAGVQARAYYRVPLHRQPAMAPFIKLSGRTPELPVTDEIARTGLALPISPCSRGRWLTRSWRRSPLPESHADLRPLTAGRKSRTAATAPGTASATAPGTVEVVRSAAA